MTMSDNQFECAVMFADVAGSTQLYEKLGDVVAQDSISQALEQMSTITSRYGGVVIKTIGDEIMCRFSTADGAIKAACNIHEVLELQSGSADVPLAVRIGIHYGPSILEEDGDVFGDAVNVAARMAGYAKARQTITTSQTVKQLAPDLAAMTREYDRTAVKGKQEEISIYEVLWEQDDVTRMVGVDIFGNNRAASQSLRLNYHDKEIEVKADSGPVVIGRGSQCDLMVQSSLASRLHARIEFRRGKALLIDQSTNGTYVRLDDGKEVFIRREELPISGHGTISLGESISGKGEHLIYYFFQSDLG